MNEYLISAGIVLNIIMFVLIIIVVIKSIGYLTSKIEEFFTTTTIEKGTTFYNHSKNLRIKTKRDIRIKYRHKWMVEAYIDDNLLLGELTLGINKKHAQKELEKALMRGVGKAYEDGINSVFMDKYVEKVENINKK